MRQKCITRFRDKYAPKVRKSQHTTFWTIWKLSKLSENFPHCLDIFQPVWKLSGPFGNFTNCPETFQTVWKLSRQIFYCLQYCCNIHILHFCKKSFGMYVAKAIYALLAHTCRGNDLRTPSGKFLRVKFCRPEIWDFLCLWRGVTP